MGPGLQDATTIENTQSEMTGVQASWLRIQGLVDGNRKRRFPQIQDFRGLCSAKRCGLSKSALSSKTLICIPLLHELLHLTLLLWCSMQDCAKSILHSETSGFGRDGIRIAFCMRLLPVHLALPLIAHVLHVSPCCSESRCKGSVQGLP